MASIPVILLADCDSWRAESFQGTLSPEERSRADRFRRVEDRDRFVVRRGLLRRLLGSRLGCPPVEVPIGVGPHGKPVLVPSRSTEKCHALRAARWPGFNLSRSGSLVLYALAPAPEPGFPAGPGVQEGPAIGVDLERVDGDRRTLDDLLRVACHFAPEESSLLRALPTARATAAFYRFWTCKEACLKSLGTGIGGEGAPTLAEVTLEIGSDGDVRRARWPREGLSWDLACLEPCVGHVAAVALPGGDGRDVARWRRPIELVRLEPEAFERRVSPGDAPPPGRGRGAP